MSKNGEYVFVLWGDQFDEAIEAIFVTELRKAGLRVKVVSLTNRRTSGMSGLTLIADLTLETALPLANKACCVVIPCKSSVMKHLSNDPRLSEFFQRAQLNDAMVILGENPPNANLFPSSATVTIYPDTEDLVTFVRQVARELGPL